MLKAAQDYHVFLRQKELRVMCGIIGIVGTAPVQDRLIESLRRLEYRGYDSAGIAGVVGGKIERRRAKG